VRALFAKNEVRFARAEQLYGYGVDAQAAWTWTGHCEEDV